MPLQNRVMPTGEIVAIPLRGLYTGNRGILHDADRRLGPARWKHRNWICCALSFRGWHRVPMSPGTWTELFFHDEAVAFAAGHRPCAECRRPDYRRFLAAWEAAFATRPSAPALDAALHAARVVPGARQLRRHQAAFDSLPDGAFVLRDGTPALVRGDRLHPFGLTGYGPPVARPEREEAEVLTPAPVLAVFRAGYSPALHPSLEG